MIGVPIPTQHLGGLDSLLSIVQMPRGIPVATVAIGNADNAALLAAAILALSDPALAERLRGPASGLDAVGHGRPLERRGAAGRVRADRPRPRRLGDSAMDDERWQPGMPVLDRQPVQAAVSPAATVRGATPEGRPRSVPETAPTPLQKHFVLLSAPALVAGAIAITALEMGAGFDSPIVRLCVLIAAPLLFITTLDAMVRIWRSAWAWMPVDRGRGLFRLAWLVVAAVFLALIVTAVALALGIGG